MRRPGFSFLVCPDAALIRERIERLLTEAGGDFERHVFWGDDEIGPGFWQALSGGSLLGRKKAVILRRAHVLPPEFWKKLVGPLKGFNDAAWPFFCLEAAPAKGKKATGMPKGLADTPYFEFAGKQKWVWTSPGLTPEAIGPMLRDWAARRGISLAPGVREALSGLIPPDMAAADNELKKLELSLEGRQTIERRDLDILHHHAGMDSFAFLDALSRPKAAPEVWREILDRQSAGEEMIFAFLGLLLYEARQLWRFQVGEADAVRLSPSARSKKEAMAARLGPRGIARIFDLALDAELGIKSGAKRPDQAMEDLTARLCRLLGP